MQCVISHNGTQDEYLGPIHKSIAPAAVAQNGCIIRQLIGKNGWKHSQHVSFRLFIINNRTGCFLPPRRLRDQSQEFTSHQQQQQQHCFSKVLQISGNRIDAIKFLHKLNPLDGTKVKTFTASHSSCRIDFLSFAGFVKKKCKWTAAAAARVFQNGR